MTYGHESFSITQFETALARTVRGHERDCENRTCVSVESVNYVNSAALYTREIIRVRS